MCTHWKIVVVASVSFTVTSHVRVMMIVRL